MEASVTLEFLLIVPFFLIMMATIAQCALYLNAKIIVQYAASCAVRSAIVWIPVEEDGEPRNRLNDPDNSKKFDRIKSAADFACIPIASTSAAALLASFDDSDSDADDEAFYSDIIESAEQRLREEIEGVIDWWMDLLPGSPITWFARKWFMSRLLTEVSMRSGGYGRNELVVVSVRHRYIMPIPGPFTAIKGYVDITETAALPNQGEQDWP